MGLRLSYRITRKLKKLRKLRKQTRRYNRQYNHKKIEQHGGVSLISENNLKMIIKYHFKSGDIHEYLQIVSGKKNIDMTEEYNLKKLDKEPLLEITGLDADKKYLLVMTDPDALGKTWIHWVVVVNGSGQLVKPAIAEYKGPSPPAGSGVHRYIFRLYDLAMVGQIPRKINDNERGSYYADVLSDILANKNIILEASYSVDSSKI